MIKTPEEYYSRRGCEKTLRFVLGFIILLSTLLISRCESPEPEPQTCFVCTVKTTWFYGLYTVTSERDYSYCDVDQEWVKHFESINTYTDTLTKMIQTCNCK